ncbi:hypothetical protein BN12_1560015 [Nostocoides japonicum T1-X7]|uniref:Uncharacterized protein n=1 Tax=Nostocoides japonicum T1-X7 TaxID=1194083 RepID=A0A077LYD0_9MICO|nr:hypothetical protein BN12_1560015 [Tetrasphaera japonica T1-X7]
MLPPPEQPHRESRYPATAAAAPHTSTRPAPPRVEVPSDRRSSTHYLYPTGPTTSRGTQRPPQRHPIPPPDRPLRESRYPATIAAAPIRRIARDTSTDPPLHESRYPATAAAAPITSTRADPPRVEVSTDHRSGTPYLHPTGPTASRGTLRPSQRHPHVESPEIPPPVRILPRVEVSSDHRSGTPYLQPGGPISVEVSSDHRSGTYYLHPSGPTASRGIDRPGSRRRDGPFWSA